MSDEELVERCLRGDTGAFSLLVDRYKGQVYNLAAKMLGNPLDAEDAAQEAFVQAYRALPSYRGQSRFSTWLYRIAVNRTLDLLRRRQNPTRQASSLEAPDGQREGGLAGRLASREPGPEDQVLQSETRARLRRALHELPEHYRAVVVLYHFQGLSYRQIGEVLGVPLRTVETRLYRAKAMLKAALHEAEQGGVRHALSGSSDPAASLSQ